METVITKAPTERNTSAIVESWSNLVFLEHEPDRHGQLAWNVRLVLGDLPPWRFGPFQTKKNAASAMCRLIQLFDEAIGDIPAELAGFAGCAANQEL